MFQLQDSHNDFVHGASLRDIPVDKLAEQRTQKVLRHLVLISPHTQTDYIVMLL